MPVKEQVENRGTTNSCIKLLIALEQITRVTKKNMADAKFNVHRYNAC